MSACFLYSSTERNEETMKKSLIHMSNWLLTMTLTKLLLRPHVQGRQICRGHRFNRQTTSEQQKNILENQCSISTTISMH